MHFLTLTASILTGCYIIISIFLLFGWLKSYFKPKSLDSIQFENFSIILPVRNEEKNLIQWINSINELNYPIDNVELIVIDDHSTDETQKQIEFIKQKSKFNFKSTQLNNKEFNKKQALEKGISMSTFDLIITTDADCTYQKNWLDSINKFYQNEMPKMIIGPVSMKYSYKNIFQKLQSIEFMSLVGAGMSFANLKAPIMSNGANLIYEKAAFYEINGYSGIDHLVSGDDVLLTEKFNSKFKNRIMPLFDTDAIVYTDSSINFSSFLHQRIRWASKTKQTKFIISKILGFILLLFNVSILINATLSLFYASLVEFFILQYIIKFVFDFLFIFLVASFFKETRLLWYYPILAMIYPIYIAIVGIGSISGDFEWKERSFKNGQ